MLPNQISAQRFTTVGKGGYKAEEVDVFLQKIYQNYSKLFSDNNVLKERLTAISPLIEEYNENKKAIANALIWAQTTSDKTITDAKSEAERILEAAKNEGDSILSVKKAEAEAVYADELKKTEELLAQSKAELERIKNETEALSKAYIESINSKANEVIEDANSKASRIVADAYNDAKTAREKADAVLFEAKNELEALKNQASKLKAEINHVFEATSKAVELIDIKDFDEIVKSEPTVEAKLIDKDDVEEFRLDFSAEIKKTEHKEPPVINKVTNFAVETVVNDADTSSEAEDYISGAPDADMPDVNAYISKIFESAGAEDTDFSSFTEGLNDMLAQSLEENDISFEALRKSMDKETADVE